MLLETADDTFPRKDVIISEKKESTNYSSNSKVLMPDMEIIKTITLKALEQRSIRKENSEISELQYQQLRDLTERERQALRQKTNFHEGLLNMIKIDKQGNYHVTGINEKLTYLEAEILGIPYVKKNIEINDVVLTVVVPEFSSIFDVDVPESIRDVGDTVIFRYCTKDLKEYLSARPEAKERFAFVQLKAIEKEYPRIPGFVWHYSELPGKILLVDSKIHFNTRHIGGDFLWCNGIR